MIFLTDASHVHMAHYILSINKTIGFDNKFRLLL